MVLNSEVSLNRHLPLALTDLERNAHAMHVHIVHAVIGEAVQHFDNMTVIAKSPGGRTHSQACHARQTFTL